MVTNARFKASITLGLLAIYFFWGGTYLAQKIALETIPPFVLGGARALTGGLILFAWGIFKGQKLPAKSHWLYGSLLGFIMLFISQGGIIWAQQVVPSGIAAVIFASMPLWMTLIAWFFQGSERPNFLVIFGLIIGFSGIFLQVKDSLFGVTLNRGNWIAYLMLILAAISWAWGSLYSRVLRLPESALMSTALQMISGGVFFLLASAFTGEWGQLHIISISSRSWVALIYLILFGSAISFSAYIWLVKVANPIMVSTYAFVNPIVAVFLGFFLAGEPLTLNDLFAGVLILISVIVINFTNNSSKQKGVSEPANPISKQGIL